MALPNVGGGFQVADGNLNEVTMVARPQVRTITAAAILAAAILAAADFASGIIYATSSGNYALTTPTGAELDTMFGNAKVGVFV